MPNSLPRIILIGAHPDDCELKEEEPRVGGAGSAIT
jgi:hypothetical protein